MTDYLAFRKYCTGITDYKAIAEKIVKDFITDFDFLDFLDLEDQFKETMYASELTGKLADQLEKADKAGLHDLVETIKYMIE